MYTKYIVLSTPRTGSNYLVHLLSSHPHVKSYGELYNPRLLYGNPKRTTIDIFPGNVLFPLARSLSPAITLQSFIYKSYNNNPQAVGFKIFYGHAKHGSQRNVWSYLKTQRDIHIVHLTRGNWLASLASFYVARQTKKFIQFSDENSQMRTSIAIEPSACLEYFEELDAFQNYYRRFFANHPWFHIQYENLTNPSSNCVVLLQRFLRVSIRQLSAPTTKQERRPLHQVITNYSTLSKYFEHTKWRRFFHSSV